MLTIIIPAYNEASVINGCLESLVAQTYVGPLEIVVAANGCTDKTAAMARLFEQDFEKKGHSLIVLEITRGNKNNAINHSDSIASFNNRLYLDADVVCDTDLIEQLVNELKITRPVYVSGTLNIQEGPSFSVTVHGGGLGRYSMLT